VRVVRFVLGALAIALASMLVTAPAARAHAVVLETTPANWQILAQAPREVSIRFSEPVDLGLTAIRLIDPQGAETALGHPVRVAGKPSTVSVALPALSGQGTFTVAWRAVSADTHPVQGAFSFSVGAPTGAGAQAEMSAPGGSALVGVLYAGMRWMGFVGFALLVGTAYFVAGCWPAGRARRGMRVLAGTGWLALALGTLLTLMLYGSYATQQPFGSVWQPDNWRGALHSRMGLALAMRFGVLVVIVVAWLAWSRHTRGVRDGHDPDDGAQHRDLIWRRGVVLAGAVLLGYTWAVATHSAAGSYRVAAEISDALHMAAMGVWLGGLVVLGAVLLRAGDPVAMRVALPRFSSAVPWCVGVLLVTGTFQAWREVGSVPALFETGYGRFLMIKLALVAGLLGLGWLARAWVRANYGFVVRSISDKRRARRGPQGGEIQRLRKGIVFEAILAAALLGVTAHLVNATPAGAEIAARRPVAATAARGPVNLAVPFDAAGGAESGRGLVDLVVAPAGVGANEIHLSVLNRAGLPRDVEELRAAFTLPEKSLGPLPVSLQYGGAPGHYVAVGAVLPTPGRWILGVTVRTSEVDQATLRIPITVATPERVSR
jgi:copper transport protein